MAAGYSSEYEVYLTRENGVKLLREQCPEAYIQVGFAGESIMGIHGSIEFDGQVVAGVYPHQYVHLAEKAGANVCSPPRTTSLLCTTKVRPYRARHGSHYQMISPSTSTIPRHSAISRPTTCTKGRR
ncbi:MAG: hypothetical protein E7Z65_05970 [Thermoplasmata archaeon]|nr:hypothetical protein [Thermoplasmata archaeon]